MLRTLWRATALALLLISSLVLLATCVSQSTAASGPLYVQDVTSNPEQFAGQNITVDGAYLVRLDQAGNGPLLALGVSTLDNGLDAQPLGDPIWLENFPEDVTTSLHRPGDAVYGFVRVNGVFSAGGGYGPEGQYQFRLEVASAEAIEQIRRVEHAIEDRDLGEGKVSFFELQGNPEQYNGQTITTQGYYFWNSVIYVLAEGVTTEEDGASPQPMGSPIWMEGFPPDQSALLNVGPNNSYVWGLVEVTGTFQTGGGFGRDGAYQSLLTVESATALETE